MNVAFRVDASPVIGTGHFMRCLSLADGLHRTGAHIRFLSRDLPDHLHTMLRSRRYEFVPLPEISGAEETDDGPHGGWVGITQAADAHSTIHALSPDTWQWLVVDHYLIDARWEHAVRHAGARILVIDDLANRPHICDLLVDQNLYADMETRYDGKVPPGSRLLLGPRFALLREEFGRLHEQVRPRTGAVKRVLVCFGGVDAGNYTSLAIAALAGQGMADVQVDVVIGGQHPGRADVELACTRHGFHCHVDTDAMAELMTAADLAVGAGGSSSWERCCLGLPALVFSVADNQRRVVDHAAVRGLVYAPDCHPTTAAPLALHLAALLDNARLREMISRKGLEAVDGRGVSRVVRALGCSAIIVRRATPDDGASLFTWRNHPSIRTMSRNTHAIEPDAHDAWLAAVLASSDQILLIGEREGAPVGVVRFDVAGSEAEVSIYLVPDFLGSGLGATLLLAAETWFTAHHPEVRAIKADVLDSNVHSQHFFQSAGYRPHSAMFSKRALSA